MIYDKPVSEVDWFADFSQSSWEGEIDPNV